MKWSNWMYGSKRFLFLEKLFIAHDNTSSFLSDGRVDLLVILIQILASTKFKTAHIEHLRVVCDRIEGLPEDEVFKVSMICRCANKLTEHSDVIAWNIIYQMLQKNKQGGQKFNHLYSVTIEKLLRIISNTAISKEILKSAIELLFYVYKENPCRIDDAKISKETRNNIELYTNGRNLVNAIDNYMQKNTHFGN
jgi:hypothetical protein